MRAFLLFLLLLLGGCVGTAGGRQIGDITWRASDLNGVPLASGSAITLQLTGGNRVSGTAGCNRYSGNYRLMNREGIDFTDIISTTGACPRPEVMEQERRFLSILESVEGYSFYSDGGMSLVSPDGRAIRFRR